MSRRGSGTTARDELFAEHASPLTLPAIDAALRYWPALLEGAAADACFERLCEECDWRQHEVRIAGRVIPCPRLSAWHGDAGAVYGYSGARYRPAPWTPALAAVRARVEQATGAPFNSVLANLYRDGRDSMGWHSDDEPELGERPIIAALSLGAERRFALRHRHRKDVPAVRLDLAHGSLLLMAGDTQTHWRHAVPRTRRPVGARLSLTFRQVRHP